MLRRNSGFVVGCVLAAGASFFTADLLTSDQVSLTVPLLEGSTEYDTEAGSEKTLAAEKEESRTFQTDPFTVMASGAIVKGVETEKPKKETERESESETGTPAETDENGNPVSSGDGTNVPEGTQPEDSSGNGADGSGDGTDGSGDWSDPSGTGSGDYTDPSGGGSGDYTEPIEIVDPGNGDYSYGDDGNGGGSGGDWTGDDGNGGDWTGDDGNGGDWTGDDGNGGGGSDDGGHSDGYGAWTPAEVVLWGISSRYIDESELYNYDAGQLRLIRNEIFALHGRIFRSQDLADYFSQRSWYVPTYDPDEFDANMFDYLNDYEEANLKVILNYEDALAGY